MKTLAKNSKASKIRRSSPCPQMPVAPAELGEFAQKLDLAFREVAAGLVTMREVEVAEPGDHSPRTVRAIRESMQVSQGVFALLVGVSSETIENWEQGVISPRPIARRLLDMIAADPKAYRAMFLTRIEPKSKRRKAI